MEQLAFEAEWFGTNHGNDDIGLLIDPNLTYSGDPDNYEELAQFAANVALSHANHEFGETEDVEPAPSIDLENMDHDVGGVADVDHSPIIDLDHANHEVGSGLIIDLDNEDHEVGGIASVGPGPVIALGNVNHGGNGVAVPASVVDDGHANHGFDEIASVGPVPIVGLEDGNHGFGGDALVRPAPIIALDNASHAGEGLAGPASNNPDAALLVPQQDASIPGSLVSMGVNNNVFLDDSIVFDGAALNQARRRRRSAPVRQPAASGVIDAGARVSKPATRRRRAARATNPNPTTYHVPDVTVNDGDNGGEEPKWERKIGSVLDVDDPIMCPICFHAFRGRNGYFDHMLQKEHIPRNVLQDDLQFSNPKPMSWFTQRGIDVTYRGTDRKQINARRRMEMGMRSDDPGYLQDVYFDTPKERAMVNMQARRDAEGK